jgi:hypothetical protein
MTDKHPDHFVQIVIDDSLELGDITVFTQMFLSFNITTERLDKNITEDRHILIYLSLDINNVDISVPKDGFDIHTSSKCDLYINFRYNGHRKVYRIERRCHCRKENISYPGQ